MEPDVFHERSRPAPGNYNMDRLCPLVVFLTVCVKNRQPLLANDRAHLLLRQAWQEADRWRVGRHVIMPDHVHLFASPVACDAPLENWVRYWKSLFRKRYGVPEFRWQSGHWDTRLRRGESYDAKWECVRWNPVRHGLVGKPEEWKYQGEIHVLVWE